MDPDIQSVLYTEQQLSDAVNSIAEKINEDYRGRELVVVGILKGSALFLADLFRRLELRCTLDFMAVSSYGSSTVSGGGLKFRKDLDTDISGKDVLIVEDILDTGNTLYRLRDHLMKRSPASLKICTLFDKPSRRIAEITADYFGFEIGDEFIVGYGLDFDEHYRNLPYVGILKPELYMAPEKTKE